MSVEGRGTRPADLSDRVEDDPRLASLGETAASGLTEAEAVRRRSLGMGNDVAIKTGRTYFEIFRDTALSPVNVILAAIALVLAVLGLYGDAAVTVVLVLLNVVVAVFQEGRAKRTLDRLSVLTRPTTTIVRDGQKKVVDQR
jgi:cation-transporting P-type ATPase E